MKLEGVQQVPGWVLAGVSPTRERDSVKKQAVRDGWLLFGSLLLLAVSVQMLAHPFNSVMVWAVIGAALGAAWRAGRSLLAIRWLDRTQFWAAAAELPKTKAELRAERFWIPDMVFVGVIGVVVAGIAFVLMVLLFE